jgi:hypothetical protein
MKLTLIAILSITLSGCSTMREGSITKAVGPRLVTEDIELATDFLNALLRPNDTSFRVIADADSEESMRHIPLATRNKELQGLLTSLRVPPNSTVTVNLQSAALPKPSGSDHYVYTFDTRSGKLDEVGLYKIGSDSADMWMQIIHWQNGTRLVSLSFTWVHDLKIHIFHLRAGEQTFRFAITTELVD